MKFKYRITGLDCPNCAAKLSATMEKRDGIDTAKINFLTEKITVESTLPEEEVYQVVKECAAAFSKEIVIEK